MIRGRWAFVLLVVSTLQGCSMAHTIGADASATIDATLSDGGTIDAGTVPRPGPGGASCGPNRCRTDEICCDDRCGICAFDGECPSYDCPAPDGD